eukprot:NODE_173_length_2114_cov_313.467312_g137_i0.p1 GENE.NODE_173_length_2114_cov_313.467312_g137_i0~~NODE_173_length_2114_cov_313.467312_g137_i0.p1  ORF type:complete len:656 (+),score=196.26 NODE_173_length_2114_cov_313.467312_g137_i0:63-1970(+)
MSTEPEPFLPVKKLPSDAQSAQRAADKAAAFLAHAQQVDGHHGARSHVLQPPSDKVRMGAASVGRKLLSAKDAERDSDDSSDEEFGFSEDEDYDLLEDYDPETGEKIAAVTFQSSHPNRQSTDNKTYQPAQSVASGKHSGKINVDYQAFSQTVRSAVNSIERKTAGQRHDVDKSERATCEQVLDPRTRLILFKLVNARTVASINGCISTGKEANVYHSKGPNDEDLAIKVYKTSILHFRDRDRYVAGEYRFRTGYCKSNPRKMVRTWAEKEFRNLKRIHLAGIPCPAVVTLKQHVLVMEFLGHEGWPAPRLHDVKLDESHMRSGYMQLVRIMHTLYHHCKLVHGDLSEYNILFHKGMLYVIDVSQSVEHDHPHSLEFLRMDCTNVTRFYQAALGNVMTMQELFNFVTDPTITDDKVDAYLQHMQEVIANRPAGWAAENEVDEEVFKKVHIPRGLGEIPDHEAHADRVAAGDTDQTYFGVVCGTDPTNMSVRNEPELLLQSRPRVDVNGVDEPTATATVNSVSASAESSVAAKPGLVQVSDEHTKAEKDAENDQQVKGGEEEEEGGGDEEEEEGSESDEGNAGERRKINKCPTAGMEFADKKEHKKFIKEFNRVRRANKVPKHLKKRRKAVANQNS